MIGCGNRAWDDCDSVSASIRDLESRAVFGPRSPMIVDARGADVGMAKPFLHLSNVGFVVERVGRGRRPERMRTNPKA